MIRLQDLHGRILKLSIERLQHLESHHPEMLNQVERIRETLLQPDEIIGSLVDPTVELFHRFYKVTPVTSLCSLCRVGKCLFAHQFTRFGGGQR